MSSSPPSEPPPSPSLPYPLYNKTYTLYRLSPLHNFPTPATPTTLTQHARRLHSLLRGDILRGVHVDPESSTSGPVNAGKLEGCEWKVLEGEEARGRSVGGGESTEAAGVQIEIHYEKSSYTALLLRHRVTGTDAKVSKEEEEEAAHFPLLLMHMPASLRGVVVDYLTSAFDTRMEEMRLSSSLIQEVLEGFLGDLSSSPTTGGGVMVAQVVKELQVTLAFRGDGGSALRSLDVRVRREDVEGFLRRGKAAASTSPLTTTGGRRTGEVDGTVVGGMGPFMGALGRYLKEHLALDIEHEDVGVSKVACGGFVLAREGRVKILAPGGAGGGEAGEGEGSRSARRAIAGLMARLFERAELRGFEDELGG